MVGSKRWLRGSVCFVFSLFGCGPEVLEVDYGCFQLAEGALVVTEVHANPDGSDGHEEYIELFNPNDTAVSLVGVVVSAGRSDGSGSKSHRMLEGSVPAEGYFVLGNAPRTAMPEHVDYSYGDALGSLRNSEGVVSVSCGTQLLDRVLYETTTDGRALELDGRLAPHHETNDDPSAWCPTPEGAGAMGEGNFGTPGRRNSPCEAAPLDGTCIEGNSTRTAVAPRAEDVRITEWMANPDGPDADLEWIELGFAADADLNGLRLGPSIEELTTVVEEGRCVPVGAGARVVFGASPAAAPRVDAELGFSLGNSGSRSIVAAVDGAVLDRVIYEETVEGAAWQIDDEGVLCLAGSANEYALGNVGTPGEPNPACPPVLERGMCLDGGVSRPIVSPSLGEAWISEWMADPAAVDNRLGEWVEIGVDAPVDLNGLTLKDLTASSTTLDDDACLAVDAGSRVVLARSLDPRANGGIEDVFAELSLSLNNREETLTLSANGAMLDVVTYARSESGASTQLDDLGNVCVASSPYGDGDLGTPGAANPRCF